MRKRTHNLIPNVILNRFTCKMIKLKWMHTFDTVFCKYIHHYLISMRLFYSNIGQRFKKRVSQLFIPVEVSIHPCNQRLSQKQRRVGKTRTFQFCHVTGLLYCTPPYSRIFIQYALNFHVNSKYRCLYDCVLVFRGPSW